jgi:hypothetical protein
VSWGNLFKAFAPHCRRIVHFIFTNGETFLARDRFTLTSPCSFARRSWSAQ